MPLEPALPFLIYRLAQYLRLRLRGWRLPLAVALFVFLTSWGVMALVEPAGSDIASPATYWWYFLVTSATVGYGDVFPVSTGGRIVGIYVIVGGIVTLTLLFTQLATALQSVRGRRTRGVIALDLSDHVVVLGYHPGRTERIIAELTSDHHFAVVLCAWDVVGEDPLPDRPDVHFVRGDLTDEDVMTRACVGRARTAVIDARDDNEALAIAVAVDHANPGIHLVAALRDLGRRNTLRYINDGVQTVQWHMPFLLSEEASDPGITQIYNDLMSSGGHGNTYSVRIPPGFPHATFGDCQTWFGRTFGATVLALRTPEGLVVSPPWDRPVPEGCTLYYVAGRRIDADRLTAAR
jgi:voltage-gated potassium channel